VILWTFMALLVAAYCLARSVADWRAGRKRWALAGLAAFATILLTPIQTHAVKVDLPVAG
jgi:hypothetical protein